MRSSILRLAMGLGLLTLAACASSTPYQRAGTGNVSGGYSDTQLASDRFQVTFSGNTLTSRETVEGYLLYRAAELTLEQGYDWFAIENRELQHDVRSSVVPDPLYHPWYGTDYVYWTPYWRYHRLHGPWMTWSPYDSDPFWTYRMDVRTVEQYQAAADISLHHGAKPTDNPKAFDAHAVIETMAPRIHRPEP